MKAASISELRKALKCLSEDDLQDACLRLARSKVENKELLTYLLFQASDEAGYIEQVCHEIDSNLPQTERIHKKTLRKLVRWINKWIRFSGNKETELEIRIHFCRRLTDHRLTFQRCRVSRNLYATQLKKIEAAMEKLHPDLQFDYRTQAAGLDEFLHT